MEEVEESLGPGEDEEEVDISSVRNPESSACVCDLLICTSSLVRLILAIFTADCFLALDQLADPSLNLYLLLFRDPLSNMSS